MPLDFSGSFRFLALILGTVVAVTSGCSGSPDKAKNTSSSGAGPVAAPPAHTEKPAASEEKPAVSQEKPAPPAKSTASSPAPAPDTNDMPVPTTPVRPKTGND